MSQHGSLEADLATAAPPIGALRTRRSLSSHGWFGGAVGFTSLLIVWELLALTVFASKHIVPTPTSVVQGIWNDRALYGENIPATMRRAGEGWVWGNTFALGLAILVVEFPLAERFALRLAVIAYSLPLIAIGPILIILLNGDAPAATLAALSVSFTTLVQTILGLRSADRTSLELVRVYGGGWWSRMTKVRLKTALPAMFTGLSIAGPAAVLGAIIGEYLGSTIGLGVFMINSEQAVNVPRTWGIAIVASALAGLAYAVTSLVGRALTPWIPRGRRVR
jgi:ABC-type nitrate/sulfonate/bicarbonate transport system permease component